jgi:glycosyltransferase involved in cell wall biosynthesis
MLGRGEVRGGGREAPAVSNRVSLIMIVKDEAETLPRCLGSVAGLVDEVVVVDTGSADGTPEVAARLGARVDRVRWVDSFASARNESLRRATGDWVFWLDADEWLDEPSRARLRTLIDRLGDEDVVYLMHQLSALGIPGAGTGPLSVAQPRLFRSHPDVCWRHRVHEQILPSCLARGAQVCLSDVVIRHSGYGSAEGLRRKQERNLRLLEEERAENPDDPWVLLQLGHQFLEHRFDEARDLLQRALRLVLPDGPLTRQIYPLLARGYRLHGDRPRAEQVVREGLALHPNDTTLLFESGFLAFEDGYFDRTEAAFTALLDRPPDPEELLGAVDLSLRGWRTRHNLALVYRKQGRLAEAEVHWRAASAEKPDAAPVWRGLAELYLAQSRWDELEPALRMLEAHAPGCAEVSPDDASFFRACAHLSRREFAPGRALLADVIARNPGALWPRYLLGQACAQ